MLQEAFWKRQGERTCKDPCREIVAQPTGPRGGRSPGWATPIAPAADRGPAACSRWRPPIASPADNVS